MPFGVGETVSTTAIFDSDYYVSNFTGMEQLSYRAIPVSVKGNNGSGLRFPNREPSPENRQVICPLPEDMLQ